MKAGTLITIIQYIRSSTLDNNSGRVSSDKYQTAFAVTCFQASSDMHKCSGGLHISLHLAWTTRPLAVNFHMTGRYVSLAMVIQSAMCDNFCAKFTKLVKHGNIYLTVPCMVF